MEKKKLAPKPHLELLIPDKKKKKEEVQVAFTEEEVLRNETWHGKKDVTTESPEIKTTERSKRGGTVHSLDEARDRKAKKQQDAPAVDAEPALETREQTVLDSEYIPVEEKVVSAAEIREVREQEEEKIGVIAQEIFDKRMQGVDAERIDAMLVEKGIKPWTPEAEEFMRTWDWERAEKIYAGIAQKQEAAIETVNGAKKKQHIELSESQESVLAAQLEQFGIKAADLEQIGGFDALTYGQRLLVIENLRQATLGRVHEEATDRHQKDIAGARWYGKIWRNVFSKPRIAKHEWETAHEIMHGGLTHHREVLEQLTAGAERMGLDVAVEQGGSLTIQYLTANELLDPVGKEQIVKFNAAGQAFSKLPAEWSFAREGSKERKEYDRVLGEFEQIKRELLKKEASIFGDANAMHAMANAEFKIRSNQFFNTHPNALDELASIESGAVWKRGFGGMSKVQERGVQMSLGAIGRVAGASLLGKAAALPIVGGVIGGIMARKRAEEAFVAQEQQARGGGRVSERFKDMMYATMPATHLRDRLEQTINAVRRSEHDPEQLKKYLAALQARLEFTTSKLQGGRVDLGSRDVRVGNQYDLFDAMGTGWAMLEQAKIIDALEDEKKTEVRSRRLDKLFAKEYEEVEALRDIYKGREARKGMVIGATFSLVGYFIAQEVIAGPAEAHAADLPGTKGASSSLKEIAGPAEAHAASDSTSGIRKYPMPPRPEGAVSATQETGSGAGAANTAGPDAHRSGPMERRPMPPRMERHPIPPRPSGNVPVAQEAAPGAGAKGAAVAAHEAVPSSEALHTTLDIGKRGPEGAFIDELKKHPEVAQRLGIKDIGKEAHAAWSEFAKQALKDPQTIKSLQDHGFAPNAKGYEEMMRRIASGKIILEEQNGKLHMRIDDTTEYLKARAPKHGVSGAALKDNDIPTGPQFLGGEPGPLAAAPAQPTPEDIPTGPQILGSSPDARPNVPLAPGVEHITDQAVASDANDIPKGPQILGGPASTAEQPFINVEAAVRDQLSEGIIDDVAREHVSSVETFVDHQFGMSGKEYAAIKQVKVGELLQQIPSRGEAWSIWRGEVPGKEIALPHDGIYGSGEFKKHVDLAEHIRAMQPDAVALQADVDTFIKHEVKSIVRPVAEAPVVAEPRVSPIIEAKPLAPDSFTVEDIPVEAQPHAAAPTTESVQPISAEAPIDGGGVPASSHVEHIPSTAPLTPEKLTLLEDDIYRSKAPVQKILMQYKVGNVAPEDFARYYSSVVADAHPSPEMLENIKVTFAEAAGEINPQRRILSQRALDSMVRRMQEGKR